MTCGMVESRVEQSARVKTVEYAYVVTTDTWGKFLPCSWQYLSPIDKKWILGDLVSAQYLASPTVAIPFLFVLEVLCVAIQFQFTLIR